ncbi:MAG TPA: DNA-processing protein DprA [Candidatus Edwardsbacteria bacterium]|nr:DNA-processing protein DprA [Candidatus Edwardsbacteria bacterium]
MKSPERLLPWLRLLAAPGVGVVRYNQLLRAFGSPQRVFAADRRALSEIEGIAERTVAALQSFRDDGFADLQLERCAKLGASIVCQDDPEYPPTLRQLADAPPLLFVRGALKPQDARSVAIVGSRNASVYGKGIASSLGRDLAHHGFCVVSGMARGIDTAGHRGALDGNGRTVAVLGCGVDVCYPPENEQLRDRIIEQGAVISEYPFGEEPLSGHFPSRNRIITGMSLGTVAVEAREDSGVFSSVRWASDQGREVFAVPGPVTAATSKGTNQLIKQGAKLVQTVDDILEELKVSIPPMPAVPEPPKPQPEKAEQPVFQALLDAPLHIDLIAQSAKTNTSEALRILLSLELKGMARQLPGKMFVRI